MTGGSLDGTPNYDAAGFQEVLGFTSGNSGVFTQSGGTNMSMIDRSDNTQKWYSCAAAWLRPRSLRSVQPAGRTPKPGRHFRGGHPPISDLRRPQTLAPECSCKPADPWERSGTADRSLTWLLVWRWAAIGSALSRTRLYPMRPPGHTPSATRTARLADHCRRLRGHRCQRHGHFHPIFRDQLPRGRRNRSRDCRL